MKKLNNKHIYNVIADSYLLQHNPLQAVSIGFSIPDAYRYAKRNNKNFADLTEKEISQFIPKK